MPNRSRRRGIPAASAPQTLLLLFSVRLGLSLRIEDIMAGMEFEWDGNKAATNLRKHGVSFEEASSVFGDPLTITFQDPAHSAAEHRFLAFGVSSRGILLVVSFIHRDKRTRLISARPATRGERKIYEEG